MKVKRSKMFKVFFAWVMLILLCLVKANASSVREISMDEMLQNSQLVFEGKVIDVEAKENSQKRIHTYVTLKIRDIIKGEYYNNNIILRFLGGTVGETTLLISDMVLPERGEQGIYFVESLERRQVHPLYGWSQGHFIVGRDAAGPEIVMTNKRYPVKGLKSNISEEPLGKGEQSSQGLSKGVVRDLIVEQKNKEVRGMRIDEFKNILYEKMRKKQ